MNYYEWAFKIFEQYVLCVFLAEDSFVGGDAPVDAERGVEDGDAIVGFGMIKFVALVLENGCLTQHGEAVGKAFRHEELPVILFCQLYGDVLSVGGRTFADVNGNVEHCAFYAADEFALCEGWALEVQAAHDAIRRHALVVLYEVDGADLRVELPLGEGLEEVATGIFEYSWFYD